MIDVLLIGNGNVAWHLRKAIDSSYTLNLTQQLVRSILPEQLDDPKVVRDIEELKKADLCILAVSDQALKSVSQSLTNFTGLVVHTSGNRDLEILNSHKKRGVLYPVQTFTKGSQLDFRKIPLAIEANHEKDLLLLTTVAEALSAQVEFIDSDKRKKIHLAAVFANNFSNYMYGLAASICKEASLPFDLIKPLILETAVKVQETEPLKAQTGPAVRGDKALIAHHLDQLQGRKKEIYALLSKSLLETKD